MRQTLKRHPDSPADAALGVEVEIAHRGRNGLALRYLLTGNMRDLRVPPLTPSTRADELWRHTCFEAFVAAPPSDGYYELNFAPSTQWAAYRFDAHRTGMRAADGIGAPHIEIASTLDSFALQASLEIPHLPNDSPWRLGLAAVIEEANGRKSYWALTHPPGKADFHHPDCFAVQLPPASRT